MKPENWPDTLLVLDNGGAWDGMAVDPDDNPAGYVQAYLEHVGEDDQYDGESLMENDTWARVEWSDELGCYHRDGWDRPRPCQSEHNYKPEDLSYLPDIFSIDDAD